MSIRGIGYLDKLSLVIKELKEIAERERERERETKIFVRSAVAPTIPLIVNTLLDYSL
jgi:hypothetical protein